MIFDKIDHLDKMKNQNDKIKFEKCNLKNDGFLSFVVNQEKRVGITFKSS